MRKLPKQLLFIAVTSFIILVTFFLVSIVNVRLQAYALTSQVLGYLDPLNTSHNWCSQITGWACDLSDPSKPIQVDLYIPDPYASGRHSVAHVTANLTSGDMDKIAQHCGTATKNYTKYAHRFSFPFPSQFKTNTSVGVYVYGHGLDGKTVGLLGNSAKVTCSASTGTTPAPSTQAGTFINFIVGLRGIGFDGDMPQHTTRPMRIEVYKSTDTNIGGPGAVPIQVRNGTLTYVTSGNNAGYFVSSTSPISFNLGTGDYQFLIIVDRYLYSLVTNPANTQNPTVIHIASGTTTTVGPVLLNPGDVAVANGGRNHIKIDDYNLMISCYGDKATTSSCPISTAGPGSTNLADLNDDGQVTIVDLNIWLRSLFLLQTNNAPGCSTGDCQGD